MHRHTHRDSIILVDGPDHKNVGYDEDVGELNIDKEVVPTDNDMCRVNKNISDPITLAEDPDGYKNTGTNLEPTFKPHDSIEVR